MVKFVRVEYVYLMVLFILDKLVFFIVMVIVLLIVLFGIWLILMEVGCFVEDGLFVIGVIFDIKII